MDMFDIIEKKRDGKKLTDREIRFFINNYVDGAIHDYQAAALLMAMYINGLERGETAQLTKAMAHSGEMVNLDSLGTVADKHSTGGVADSTTLIVLPLVCACGLKIAKMSGRSLGHTGGTIDKLESIPGFNTSLDVHSFMSQIKRIGVAITAQTPNLCPADKLIYSLRDSTATIDSIPLIASSIMSKKLAMGAHIIVLDVKTGNGAFIKDVSEAQILAETMVAAGNSAGRKTCAVISDMSQPLGNSIGNSLEVKEAIDILNGAVPGGDLLEVSMAIAIQMLILSAKAKDKVNAKQMLDKALNSKNALNKLTDLIKAQNGNETVTVDTSLLPVANMKVPVLSQQSGYLSAVDCRSLGEIASILENKQNGRIDPAAGLVLNKRIGDKVNSGDVLVELHASDTKLLKIALAHINRCFAFSQTRVIPKLIHNIIC